MRLLRISGLFERGWSKNCLLSGDSTESLPSCGDCSKLALQPVYASNS